MVSVPIRQDFYRSWERIKRPEYFTDWHTALRPDQLPAGSGKLRAWAYDNELKRIYILRNTALITDGKLVKFELQVAPKDRPEE